MRIPLLLATALAALTLAEPAHAMDPRIPLLVGEPSAESKLAGFARAHADDARMQAALEAAAEQPLRDRIHAALLAEEPYAQAFRRYEVCPHDAGPWRALLAEDPQDLYLRAHATYFLGRALFAQDDLAGAAGALEQVRGRLRLGTPWSDEATLYLGTIYARLPELDGKDSAADRARARHVLQDLVAADGRPALYQAPERLVEGAQWLLRELRGEGLGPLLELAKRMETIERMLQRTATGEGTQRRQEQVVQVIDRLIELMRQKEQQGGGSCDKPGQQQQQQQQQQGQQPGKQSNSPAQNSKLPNADGPDGVAEGPRRADSDEWGTMKDKEREKAVQFLRERFPTRYRELIERYYRALAEQDQ